MTHHQTILLKFDFGIVQIYPMGKHQSVLVGELFLQHGPILNPYLNINFNIAYCQNVYMLFFYRCINKWLAYIGGNGSQEKTWEKELNFWGGRIWILCHAMLASGIGTTTNVSHFNGHVQRRRVSWSSLGHGGCMRNRSTWFHYVWNRWILEGLIVWLT